MLSISVLLIPFSIVCVGIIVYTIYNVIDTQCRKWYWRFRDDLIKNIDVNVKYKINDEINNRFLELAKQSPERSSQRERFQKLAGIKPIYATDRNSLRDRFNRVRATTYNYNYNDRFDLKNMMEDVYIPVRPTDSI